ncbi:VOC family protein [Nocardioides sp. zg-DK7169]|uniref:VOC family protein n=1 Tax=Nocardioides sp. zg-DK7169 TaxID=2736600 RepID=UPI001553B305|nr:VOC family protein [Nocardioides sp. zg-DK7169]NPC97523.1 glyoxalase [Nocardioides sp. zg-DK7169]
MERAVHHLDLWVDDAELAVDEWGWLLGELGWEVDIAGSSWVHPDGTYLFLERSPDQLDVAHDRMRPGLNHLALLLPEDADRAMLDRVRAESSGHGWHELFADRYPHAGGEQHTALFLENSEGFEVEVVLAER